MRGGRLSPGAGAARFDHQDRLRIFTRSYFFDLLNELRSPPEFLQVNHDHFSVRVRVQVPEQVQFIYVGFIADGDKLGKSKFPVRGKIEHGCAERSAL